MSTDRNLLLQGLESLQLSLPDEAVDRLMAYRDLLVKWNKAYNLTAVRDPQAMISLHLIDSLAALPYVPKGRLLDMGTGAGLPGIPFAIARPDLEITLLDSNGKKTRFCQQACAELTLPKVRVVQARIEAMQVDALGGLFDATCSRAFTALDGFWNVSKPLLKPGAPALALKADPSDKELEALKQQRASWHTQSLISPDGQRTRSLIVIESAT